MFGGFSFGGGGFPGGMPRGFPGGMPRGAGGGAGGGGASATEQRNTDTTKLYQVLGVAQDATTAQIKKAYLKLARKEHPDKGGDPEKFKTIQHAYDILGEEEKRKLYDAGGEDAVEAGGARGAGGASDIFDVLFGGGRRQRGPRKADADVYPLEVSLEDLYVGRTVRQASVRTVIEKDESGDIMDQTGQRYSRRQERKVFTVEVEKGMRDGQKITFDGQGDVMPGQAPGDVVFVIKTKSHSKFDRKGADLILKKEISLYESITGVSFLIEHLDGHKVHVVSKPGEVIAPDSTKQVEDEGMPIYGNTFMKGCLFVQFEVSFPQRLDDLTDAQKRALGAILGGVPAPLRLPEDEHIETKSIEDVNMQARRDRERIGQEAADSDSDGPGGAGGPRVQQVQCANQ